MARGGLPSGELVFSEILTSLEVKINTLSILARGYRKSLPFL